MPILEKMNAWLSLPITDASRFRLHATETDNLVLLPDGVGRRQALLFQPRDRLCMEVMETGEADWDDGGLGLAAPRLPGHGCLRPLLPPFSAEDRIWSRLSAMEQPPANWAALCIHLADRLTTWLYLRGYERAAIWPEPGYLQVYDAPK